MLKFERIDITLRPSRLQIPILREEYDDIDLDPFGGNALCCYEMWCCFRYHGRAQ